MKHQQKYFTCKEAGGNSVSEDALVVPHFLLANWAVMLTSNSHEKLKGPGVLRKDQCKTDD